MVTLCHSYFDQKNLKKQMLSYVAVWRITFVYTARQLEDSFGNISRVKRLRQYQTVSWPQTDSTNDNHIIKNKSNINSFKKVLLEWALAGLAVDLHAFIFGCCGSCVCGRNSAVLVSVDALAVDGSALLWFCQPWCLSSMTARPWVRDVSRESCLARGGKW